MINFKSTLLRRVKFFAIPAFFLLFTSELAAQTKISGKVTDNTGKGIPSVSVTLAGGNAGTVTEENGTFSFDAVFKNEATVTFSSIGFKTKQLKVTTGSAQNLNVTLDKDVLGMDEVVVTGTSAGTTRRQLGNYIATVKADQLNKGATGNVLAALQGKTAGAQVTQNNGDPAGGLSVRLRGVSTVYSSSEPLYIIDGVIVSNATTRVTNTQSGYDGTRSVGTIGSNKLSDINPADIERIEVLNGAAAAAIYGSRANAGVIQIFTKKGVSGAPVINVSTNFMINQLRKQVETNQAPTKFGGSPDVLTQDILLPALTTTTAVTRTNFQDYIFRTAYGTDNNISISGGKDKTKYYLSGSYLFNQGIIRNTDFSRYSFRSNIDQGINNWITASVGINYIYSKANEKPDGNSFYSPMNSVTILGNYHDIFARDGLGNLKAVGERGRINPVSVIEDIKQQQRTSRIISSLGLKLKPYKGVTVDYTMGIDNYSQEGNTFMPPFTYNANPAFWGGGASLDPTLNGYASAAVSTYFQINHELNATYQTNITRDIASTTQIGYSVQYEKTGYTLLQGRGLAPLIRTVNGASTILPGVDARGEQSISGAYLQQNFKYKNRLFITGAVRRDGSSVFAPDERNLIYLKGSGSYLISEEDFWSNSSISKWFSQLKLRLAYGQSGNLTGIGPYERFNSYSSISYLGRTSFLSSSVRANTEMKPERQSEFEVGTDMSFFGSRLNLSVNVYNKKIKDLLFDRVIAPTTGFSSRLDNFGSIENKGVEILLGGTPVNTKDFRWDVNLIYNRNRNKVINIGSPLALFATNGGAPVALLPGYAVGVFYGIFFARDANGNLIKNAAGFPQSEKGIQNSAGFYTTQRDAAGLPTGTVLRKVIGDPNPDYTATLTSDLAYKKLSLHLQFDAVHGGDVFNADWRTRQGVGNGKEAEKEHRGEYPRGYINSIYAIEEWRIDDGSFVKLRELSLAYNVGKVKGVGDITVGFSGRNLISWDKYKGFDPEVNAAGQSTLLRGIDFGSVPIPRTFSFSVKARL
jgi:TonB-linked SusC/RagA family outer membrane protein